MTPATARPTHAITYAPLLLLAAAGGRVRAEDAPAPQDWALHAQSTVVYQYHPSFTSPYEGPHSLTAASEGQETFDLTLYMGVRPWSGAELWIDPEIDQGFGLNDTLGVAGFPSGEAYKVGANRPYARLHRAFLRQSFELGGESTAAEADLNQLAGTRASDRLVFTLGKFSAVDLFDNNDYAHDPRRDFLNWSVIDAAAFDYAANAWGYTYGLAAEWYQGLWTTRLGWFDLSTIPNGTELDPHPLSHYQLVAEEERRYMLSGQPGVVRVLVSAMHGKMGVYDQATRLAEATGLPADIGAVRAMHTKTGVSLNVQQQLLPDIGAFARVSWQQAQYEGYEFTDAGQSMAIGTSVGGARWQRPGDAFGAAVVFNRESAAAYRFFDAGGLGILVGDGRLPRPGTEHLLEVFYRYAPIEHIELSLDYQLIGNPAYNGDRGPVSVYSLRLHVQY